jgi:saccharopine dehydrogenase-like NADP-dependent oxidoreductase
MILAIIGAGRIGLAVKKLLKDNFKIKICDTKVAAETAGISGIDFIDASDLKMLSSYLDYSDVVLSAVNYKFSRDIVQLALKKGKHYIDLTEDVGTTKWIQEFTMQEQRVSVIPQCGLAPGAINIIGGYLARQFEKPVSLKLRVGALPLYSANRMSYYLSWNTAGLLNEYVNMCDAIVDRIRLKVKPLEGVEKIIIDGTEYEAFNTSGGVGTLTDTFWLKINELDYKTIRYPGHVDYLRFMFEDLGLKNNMELANDIFNQNVPTTTDDVVIFFVKATGYNNGDLTEKNWVCKIYGKDGMTAIERATASGVAEVLCMLKDKKLKSGFVKQEDIPFDDFINGKFGAIYQTI